jgi:hypothetical protein
MSTETEHTLGSERFVFKVLLISSQTSGTEHQKLERFAGGQCSGHVLDVIHTHAIRHVRLDRGLGVERGSERWRSHDGWTAGKVGVGAEARRGKAVRQAMIERVEAEHHSSNSCAKNVTLYALRTCMC